MREALPSFVVRPVLPDHERGQFHRRGKDLRLWAFLQKMKDLIDTGSSEELEFFKSAVLQVSFDVVHLSGNVLDCFWASWQQGEEAKHEIVGGSTFRRMDKLEYLQAVLRAQGEPH
jgi:hypothetical protein